MRGILGPHLNFILENLHNIWCKELIFRMFLIYYLINPLCHHPTQVNKVSYDQRRKKAASARVPLSHLHKRDSIWSLDLRWSTCSSLEQESSFTLFTLVDISLPLQAICLMLHNMSTVIWKRFMCFHMSLQADTSTGHVLKIKRSYSEVEMFICSELNF